VCDNCPAKLNPQQVDCDSDGIGQVCEGGLSNACKVDDPDVCDDTGCS